MNFLRRILTRTKPEDIKPIGKKGDLNKDIALSTEQEDAVAAIAEQKDFIKALDDKGIDTNDKEQVHKHALMAFCVAGGLIAFSPSANADWIDSLAKNAAKAIQKAIEPLFESIMGAFGGTLLQFMGSSSDKLTSALGMSTDAINSVTSEIENNRIKAAVQPKPDHCTSDELGAESQKADARKETRQNIMSQKVNNFVFNTDPKKIVDNVKRQAEQYTGSKKGQNLQIGNVTQSKGLNTSADVKQAEDVVMNILGPTASVMTQDIARIMKTKSESVGYEIQSKLASKGSRIQIAMSPFSSKIASNNNTTGASRDKIFKEEIERTYGDNSNAWRKEINSAADPTPVTAELCKLTALNNRIALKQLEAIEQNNMICGATLLEIIEANTDRSLSSKI